MDEIRICYEKSDRKPYHKTDITCIKFRLSLSVLQMQTLLLMKGIKVMFECKLLSGKRR